MWRNRIILLLLIISSGIFVSIYGGSFPYAFFYSMLMVPLLAFAYTLYVYVRFKLYQSTGAKTLVKGESADYSFLLENEDLITFESLKVNFYHDRSRVLNVDESREYCLLPKQKVELATRICCDYRGDYYVGVRSIVITDFLYLFRITYPVRQALPVTVLPRVVHLEAFPALNMEMDSKYQGNGRNAEEEPDAEVRKYAAGDSLKRIHWKVSARRQEWMTRKYVESPQSRISIVMDLSGMDKGEGDSIGIEDKILEAVLAVADYYLAKKILLQIFYQQQKTERMEISTEENFNEFYQRCAHFRFQAGYQAADVLRECMPYILGTGHLLIVTHQLDDMLFKELDRLANKGGRAVVIVAASGESDERQQIRISLEQQGIRVIEILTGQEVKDRLEQRD